MNINEATSEDARTIEEFHDLISTNCKLDVELKQVRKNLKVIQINDEDPHGARKFLVNNLLPRLDIDFDVPRFTKKTGFTVEIHPKDEPETTFTIVIKKGGNHRGGRKNEINFQSYIKSQLEKNGECVLKVSDNYGVKVELDIVDVIDAAADHGTNGKMNRSDTTVKLRDGSLYGISQKKKNATYVCKIKKALKEILFQSEKRLREYARNNNLSQGDYIDVRITNRELIDLCWFGTDLATGAAFIGDLENIDSNEIKIERIIQNGDDDVLTSFPIYMKWKIVNKAYTMNLQGVCVPSLEGKWIVNDIELPGINAPMPEGKKFLTGNEVKQQRKRRYRRRRKVLEDHLIEESNQKDMWDTIAYCAENHKLLWLKYETVESGEIISRRVAPYSYRMRNTKIRGRSTYFYAEDYTPGEERQIKCFLTENCLQVKKSNKSFTPRFPIEIKMEIDKLEEKRKEEEEKKERDEKKKIEQNKANKRIEDKAKTKAKTNSLKNDEPKDSLRDKDEDENKDSSSSKRPLVKPMNKKSNDNEPKKDDIEEQNKLDDAKNDGKKQAKEDIKGMKDGQVLSVTDDKGNELEDK